jgi:hypothetical protein
MKTNLITKLMCKVLVFNMHSTEPFNSINIPKQWFSKASVLNFSNLLVMLIFGIILKITIPGIIAFFLLPLIFIYILLVNLFYLVGFFIVKSIEFANPDLSKISILSIVWICVYLISILLTILICTLFILISVPWGTRVFYWFLLCVFL